VVNLILNTSCEFQYDDFKCDISYKRFRWRRKEHHSVIYFLWPNGLSINALLFNAFPGGNNTGSSSSSSENYTLEDVKKNWRAECERMEKINAENRAAVRAAIERQDRIDSVRGMHSKLVVILSVPYCLCCKFTIITAANRPSG